MTKKENVFIFRYQDNSLEIEGYKLYSLDIKGKRLIDTLNNVYSTIDHVISTLEGKNLRIFTAEIPNRRKLYQLKGRQIEQGTKSFIYNHSLSSEEVQEFHRANLKVIEIKKLEDRLE